MKFKSAILFIIIFISIISLSAASASDDISQNTTDQLSANDEDTVVSDQYPIAYNYPTSQATISRLDNNGNIVYHELSCSVGPSSGIVFNASQQYSAPEGYKTMMHSCSKGTYDTKTGIWNIGDFDGEEHLRVLFFKETSTNRWKDFIKTDEFSNILSEFVALNQTNPLVNPNAPDRMPHYVDLILTPVAMYAVGSNGSDIAYCYMSFKVESKGGVAENTIVEYLIDENFKFLYYNATKGTYNETTGIWNVGDVSDAETLLVCSIVNKTYLLSSIDSLGRETITASTTTNEINTYNNKITRDSGVIVVVESGDTNYHQIHYASADYSEYRSVNVDNGGESKEISYSQYKHPTGNKQNINSIENKEPAKPADNHQNTNPVNNQTSNPDNQNTNSTTNTENTNSPNNQTNTNDGDNPIRNSTKNSNITKSIDLSKGDNLIIIAVLILCLLGAVVFRKFKS